MIDSATCKPIRVLTALSGPYIHVSMQQLEPLRRFLENNGVSFWVDHLSISIDGNPAMTVVNLHQRTNPQELQDLLDTQASYMVFHVQLSDER